MSTTEEGASGEMRLSNYSNEVGGSSHYEETKEVSLRASKSGKRVILTQRHRVSDMYSMSSNRNDVVETSISVAALVKWIEENGKRLKTKEAEEA